VQSIKKYGCHTELDRKMGLHNLLRRSSLDQFRISLCMLTTVLVSEFRSHSSWRVYLSAVHSILHQIEAFFLFLQLP